MSAIQSRELTANCVSRSSMGLLGSVALYDDSTVALSASPVGMAWWWWCRVSFHFAISSTSVDGCASPAAPAPALLSLCPRNPVPYWMRPYWISVMPSPAREPNLPACVVCRR